MKTTESKNPFFNNIKQQGKLALLLGILILTSSCNKEEEKAPEAAPTGLSVRIAGTSDFGRVSTEDTRFSRIEIKNNDANTKSLSISQLNSVLGNFRIDRTEGCGVGSLTVGAGAICSIRIAFSPQARGDHLDSFDINGNIVSFKGQGIIPGLLTIDPLVWNTGQILAAQPITNRFNLTNEGDNAFEIPVITGSTKFRISFTNCPEFLFPGDVCIMDLTYQEIIAGDKVEVPELQSSSGPSASVAFTSSVNPVAPSGIIQFDSFPSRMISNGADEHDITARIFDPYGNPVTDGNFVTVSGLNINLPSGQSFFSVGGKIDFKILSTTNSSDVEVLVQSGQGSGFFAVPSSSGPPSGGITFEPFNPRIRADGTSQLTVRTGLIRDVNGNVVDNGTQLNVSASGVVSVVDPVLSVFQGRAFITIQAGTTASFSNVIVTGGTATGSFAVETIPLPPSGNFAVDSEDFSIYYENTAAAPYNATTGITVGPVRDAGGNLVGAGKLVSIAIRNGVATTKSPGNQNFDIQTDADSIARFVLEGINVRGWIDIEATVNSDVTAHRVWASAESEIRYLKGGNLSLAYTFNNSDTNRSLSPLDNSWENYIGDLSKIIDVNTQFIGGTFYASGVKDLDAVDIDNVYADCLLDVGEFFFLPPCSASINEAGTVFLGSTPPYTLGTFGGPEIYEYSNFGDRLTGGVDSPYSLIPVLIDYNYHPDLDMAFIFGGHDLSGLSLSPRGSGATAYSFPSSLKTTFDPIFIKNYSSLASGIGSSGKATLETQETLYLYGGHDQTIGPSTNEISLSDTFLKVIFDGSEEDAIGVEEVDIEEDPVEEGAPPALTGSSLYQRDDGRILLIGGFYMDQTIVPNVIAHWDEIWSFNPSDSTPTWRKDCSACVPNIAGVYINQLQAMSYPVNVADIYLLESLSRRIEFIKDKTKNKVFAFDSRDSMVYSFDDQNLTFIDDSIGATAISALQGGARVIRNKITGRYATIFPTDETRKKALFRVFDGEEGKKRYYKVDFKLPEGAKLGAREYFLNFSGRASATSSDGTNTITQPGVGIYVFNYTSNQWDLVGVNTHVTDFDTFSNPDKFQLNGTLSDYVSNDSIMSIVATPLYYPGLQLGSIQEGEGVLRMSHISLEGIW